MKKKLLALTLLLSSAGVVQVANAGSHMSNNNGYECNTCCPKKKCCKRNCCRSLFGCCSRSCCC